jgi:flagellar basal-body rod modification protein FlgD
MSSITGAVLPSTLQEAGLSSPKSGKGEATKQKEFLELFVAQLKNQNPLDPKEGADFLAQLAQFSTVEGIQNMQKSMEGFESSMQSSQALHATSLVGKSVYVKSSFGVLSPGESIKGNIQLPESSGNLDIAIKDANGALVKNLSLGSQKSGDVPFLWNGLDNEGNNLPPGKYFIQATSVVDGKTTALTSSISANVDSVTVKNKSGGFILNVENFGPILLDDVNTIG